MRLLQIDELLYNVLFKEDLLIFAPVLARNTLTRVDHFNQVKDDELVSFGLPWPAIRRLRAGLTAKEVRKRVEKRAKKNLPINYIDVSHLDVQSPAKQPPEQYHQPQPSIPQQQQQPIHFEPEMIREEKASTSNNPVPLALILKEDVHLMEGLGEGTFAVVKRALWKRSDGEKKIDVAVKILREVSAIVKKDVEAEIQTMSKLHHSNLVDLYGVVLGDPMLMVMEFCDGGSLLERLRSSEKPVLLATQLLNYALQIAAGMKYLQQKGYVHRDLATRNILLKNNDETVKLCDFGLSRLVNEYDQTYDMQGATKIPFSWCPPEALRFRKFSSASDVWAFGVTIWECFTFGEEPWIGCNALSVLQTTERGERLHRPDKCSQELYELMMRCWAIEPTDRPDFSMLYAILTKVKFITRTAIKDHKPSIPAEIVMNKGDKFIVLEETTPNTLLGQNVTTRRFGHCPKVVLDMKTSASPIPSEGIQPIRKAPPKPSTGPVVSKQPQVHHIPATTSAPTMNSSMPHISAPIRNSFIHAGHGASDINHSWGTPSAIPEVYLKNPVLKPVVGTDISNAIPIQRNHSQPSIPMKYSVSNSQAQTSRSNASGSSSGFGSGNEGAFTSIEAWNRSRFNESEPAISSRSNQLPPPPFNSQRSKSPEVTMRIQPPPVQPRPKTTMGLPPPQSRKRPSMEEQARSEQAFSWIKDEMKKDPQAPFIPRPSSASGSTTLTKEETKNRLNGILSQGKGTTFSITPGEASRAVEERKDNGFKIPTGGISVMPKSPPHGKLSSSYNASTGNLSSTNGTQMNAIKPQQQPAPISANQVSTTLSSLTLANTYYSQLPPSSPNGSDPFVVSDQLKSVLQKPLYNQAITPNPLPSTPQHHQPFMMPMSVALVPQRPQNSTSYLEATPLPHFVSNNSATLPTRNNGTSSIMNGLSQLQQQQPQHILQPSTTELNYPRMSNGFVLPSTSGPMSVNPSSTTAAAAANSSTALGNFLPPPSPLLSQMTAEAAKRNQISSQPMQQQQNNGINSKPPRPMTNGPGRVIPGTGPSSSPAVNASMMSQQPQRPIALNPSSHRTVSPLPFTRNPPTAPTLDEIYAPLNPTQPFFSCSQMAPIQPSPSTQAKISLTEANELLSKVKSRVATATEAECRAALLKHQFNVEMAIKQLKIDTLLATALTHDHDLAASALDYCDWDVNQAAIHLLAN